MYQVYDMQNSEKKLLLATVCEVHFTTDCIEEHLTQLRKPDVPQRLIRRLKEGSVPTEFLQLPKGKRLWPPTNCDSEPQAKKCAG